MRLKGMELSIDDFGTGYSSLKMLRLMPFSEIKIDPVVRQRCDDVGGIAGNREIHHRPCRQHGHGLRSPKGVETEETADLLEHLGWSRNPGFFRLPGRCRSRRFPAWLAIWTQSGSVARRAEA